MLLAAVAAANNPTLTITIGAGPGEGAAGAGRMTGGGGLKPNPHAIGSTNIPAGQTAAATAAALAAAIGPTATANGNVVTIKPANSGGYIATSGMYSDIRIQRTDRPVLPPAPPPPAQPKVVNVFGPAGGTVVIGKDGTITKTFNGPGFSVTGQVNFLANETLASINQRLNNALVAQSGSLPSGMHFETELVGLSLVSVSGAPYDIEVSDAIWFNLGGTAPGIDIGVDLFDNEFFALPFVLNGPGGAIPAAGTGGGGIYPNVLAPNPFLSQISVPNHVFGLDKVVVQGLTHTYVGDLQIVLYDPLGRGTNLMMRPGFTGSGFGSSGDFTNGTYEFVPSGGSAVPPSGDIAPGTYDQHFGVWPTGTNDIHNIDMGPTSAPPGTWTLAMYDWASADVGSCTGWSLHASPPPVTTCAGSALPTIYLANNGGSNGGQVFFDLNIVNPAGIQLSQIDFNSDEPVGTGFTLSMYTTPNSYVGNHNNPGAWTLVSSGHGLLAGNNLPSIAEMGDAVLPQGQHGVALVLSSSAGFRYTNGTGSNQVYSNSDLTMTCGAALNVPWTGTPFTPRVFNGSIRYNCSEGPAAYCNAGTTTSGCVPSISGDFQPSVSQAHPCNISVASVEGQKTGLIFYGLAPTAVQWGTGTSFLCVKAPTQRTPVQSTGGTAGLCDGQLTLDWNSFHAANPGALGSPWAVGNKAYVQGWFRDPPASKTTNLSDALELTYVP